MAFTVIASTGAQSTDGATVTTPAVDCRGANLIVVSIVRTVGTLGNPTDSQGNTYTGQFAYGTGTGQGRAILYTCLNPSVSASMTFGLTATGGTGLPSIAVLAVAGAVSGSFDRQVGADSSPSTVTSVTAGPITPSQDSDLWISFVTTNTGAPANAQGILLFAAPAVAGQSWGVGFAYGIQTTAAAQSCAWSWTGASVTQDFIAAFKTGTGPPPVTIGPAFGGGGGFQPRPNSSQGFGAASGDDR